MGERLANGRQSKNQSRRTNRLHDFFRVWAGKCSRDRISIMASGAVYSTLISVIPLATLLVTFSTLLGIIQPFFNLITEFSVSIFGEQAGIELANWIKEYSTKASGLGVVGFISFLITSMMLIDKVWTIVNHLYRTSQSRTSFWKRMIGYVLILLVGALLIGAYIGVKSLLSHRIASALGLMLQENAIVGVIRVIAPWLIVWVIFFLIIKVAPNTKVAGSSAAIGATAGTIAFTIVNWALTALIAAGFNYSVIYGSFAAIFLFLLWVFFMWVVLLAAVEVSYIHQYRPDKITLKRPISPAEQLANGINVMMVIGNNFRNGTGDTRVKDISEKLLMNDRELFSLLDLLIEKRFIIATNPRKTTYIPARPLEDIKIVELVEVLYGEVYLEQNLETIGDAIVTQINDRGIKTLGNVSLYNLLERI